MAAEVEQLEPRVMLSATTVAAFVEHVESQTQQSDVSEILQAKVSKLAGLIETRLQSTGGAFDGHFDGSHIKAVLQGLQHHVQSHAGHSQTVPSVLHLHEDLIQTKQTSQDLTFHAGSQHNPLAKLTGLYVEIVSKIHEDLETIPSGSTISQEELLAGILVKIGEHFDIDFGPGDGTGCGTAELDAFIPDRIGDIDLTCACMTHDEAYGDLELTKLEADIGLFHDVYDAARDGGATKVESFLLAGIYFGSVFYFGGPSWLAAQQAAMA